MEWAGRTAAHLRASEWKTWWGVCGNSSKKTHCLIGQAKIKIYTL